MEIKRLLLFLCGCITVRFLLVYVAKTHLEWLPYLAIPALIISVGFFTIFFKGLRKTGPETFGEPIWWNSLRPFHGLLYFLFFIAACARWKFAYFFLLIDVLIGILSWSIFHFL